MGTLDPMDLRNLKGLGDEPLDASLVVLEQTETPGAVAFEL